MELLKTSGSRKPLVSELFYVGLNVGLAVAVMLAVLYTGTPWIALVLTILSKWRVLAVRPRYWWVNFQSNLVDFLVSLSVVAHLVIVNNSSLDDSPRTILMSIITAIYIGWLLYLKPKSTRRMVGFQALVSTLLSVSALFAISYSWPVSVVVACMWLIGYTAAKHAVNGFDNENDDTFLGLAWGFVFANIGWIFYHWTVAYAMPIFTAIQVPQVVIITTLLSFLGYKIYESNYKHGKVKTNDILLPLLLTVAVIAVLLLFFNRVGSAI